MYGRVVMWLGVIRTSEIITSCEIQVVQLQVAQPGGPHRGINASVPVWVCPGEKNTV